MRGGFKEQLLSAVNNFTQATVQGAKVASKFVQQEALGAQCLLDYSLGPQVASAGSGHAVWRVYTARSKKEGSPHPLVSAWILSKQELSQGSEGGTHGGGGGLTRPSQRRLDELLAQCRHDVQALARLKHPCVLRLIAPLEETRTQLVFITEPLSTSLADLLGGGGPAALAPAAAQERRSLQLSELEIKHGLLQVADGLHFLHAEAGLVHRGICPAAVVITAAGTWKLAGFGFSAPLEYRTDGGRGFDYSDPYPPLLQSLTQPPLPYVAPELVASGAAPPATGAADVFSMAALAFELLARRQLLPVGARLTEYESRVASLTLVDMTGIPAALEPTLRSMAAPVAGARPPAAAFAGCQYFQADFLLRALKFLDTMLQREAAQKAAFLQDLPRLCAQFDSRVLRYLVLPPLLQELRDASLQPVLLPIVLRIVQQQEPAEFADATLPALRPLLASAAGETLLLLVQNVELLQRCMPPALAAQVVPALLVRAAEHGDTRAQEEMLKQVAAAADSLDYQGLKAAVLPAVHKLCLATTSASVRVSAFAAMSRLAQRMDGGEAEAMLATAAKVTAVDKSAPTVMCVLALGAALARQHGPRLAAERALPALAPLLVAPTLSSQQFATAMKTMREVLAAVEKGRGSGHAAGSPQAAAAAVAALDGPLGGRPAAPPPPADWLAATAVGPSSTAGAPSRPLAASSIADPLAGLQLQAAAPPPHRPPAPAASGGAFGLAGSKVGSGKPIGSLAPPSQQQHSWAAFGSGGGGGSSFGGLAATPSSGGAAALADPFAGLQLGGVGSSGAQGSSVQRPTPAAAPNGGAAAAFDPFSLGSGTGGGGGAAAGAGGSLQWQQPQRPPQPQQGSSGSAWPAGGSLI